MTVLKKWSEIKKEQFLNILPMYDKVYVKSEAEALLREEGYTDDDFEYYVGIDGSVAIGIPDKENGCGRTIPFMFGFISTDEYGSALDDGSYFEIVAAKLFKPLIDVGLFDERDMESVASFAITSWNTEIEGFPTSVTAAEKEMLEVVSTVIGEAFSNPNDAVLKYSTKECKDYLHERWGANVKNLSRIKKCKFGNIDARVFVDKETDNQYTMLVYRGRVISSYPFTGDDF